MKKITFYLFLLLTINIFGIESNNGKKYQKAFDVEGNKFIIRPLFGIATTSDLNELITFKNFKENPQKGLLYGLQIERYVYKRPYDFPVNITLYTSFICHDNDYDENIEIDNHKEGLQYTNKNSYEINFGIKAYWVKFPWDKYVRTRLGVSEGFSYVNRITNLERYNQHSKKHSNYLNYIDITMSFNAKDITKIKDLEDTYIGVGISHRSGIFGTINGVSGGGNNVTLFFETEI